MNKLLYIYLLCAVFINLSLAGKAEVRDEDDDEDDNVFETGNDDSDGKDDHDDNDESEVDVEEREEDDDHDDDNEHESHDQAHTEDNEGEESHESDNEHIHEDHNQHEEDEFEAKHESGSPLVAENNTAATEECHVDGKVYKEGDNIPRASPCEHCTCHSGHSRCHHSHCFPRFCTKTYIPDGECCPICACKDHHGKEYHAGQKFVTEHRLFGMGEMCMECNCKANTKGHDTAHCSYQLCPPMQQCVETFVPEGKCCPICKTFGQLLKPCTFEGQRKSHGVHWKLDTCFACTCSNGEVICTKNCPKLKCHTKYRPGECCPVCEDGSTNPRTFPPFPPFPGKPKDTIKPKTFPPFPTFPTKSNNNNQPKTFPPFPKV